jgi:hypothetical protein
MTYRPPRLLNAWICLMVLLFHAGNTGNHLVSRYSAVSGVCERVQNQSNLSVPKVLLSDLALPTVLQHQRDTLD